MKKILPLTALVLLTAAVLFGSAGHMQLTGHSYVYAPDSSVRYTLAFHSNYLTLTREEYSAYAARQLTGCCQKTYPFRLLSGGRVRVAGRVYRCSVDSRSGALVFDRSFLGLCGTWLPL